MRLTHRIGLFPSAADALGRQGFARIINRSDSDGEVSIVARDDAGIEHGPLTLAIGAGETKHFNSEDLETGNAGKGLDGATGPLDKGAWRLELSSTHGAVPGARARAHAGRRRRPGGRLGTAGKEYPP